MDVVIVNNGAALAEHVNALERLAAAAIEPNVFYEPWMLVPAVESFDRGTDLVFVLLYTPDPARASGPPLLCGFFPLVRERRNLGLPVSFLTSWQHLHAFLCTPLVRAGYAAPCLEAFFGWAATPAARAHLIELRVIPGEGPFRRALTDHFRRHQIPILHRTSYTRAFFRRPAPGGAPAAPALSRSRRNDLKRLERRFSEAGAVEYRALERGDDLESWLERFLACEAAGWKGKDCSALAMNERERSFFMAAARGAFQRDQLQLLALHLDGRPIAMRCSWRSPPGSYFFKPAYDEAYARFSPGVLLEMEALRRLQAQSEVQWMDSCTSPDNALLNELWPDRVAIETLWIPAGRGLGELLVSLAPLGRWLRRRAAELARRVPHRAPSPATPGEP